VDRADLGGRVGAVSAVDVMWLVSSVVVSVSCICDMISSYRTRKLMRAIRDERNERNADMLRLISAFERDAP
jgi:hypothetical protein